MQSAQTDPTSDPVFLQGLQSILDPYREQGASENAIEQVTERAYAFYIQSQKQQQQQQQQISTVPHTHSNANSTLSSESIANADICFNTAPSSRASGPTDTVISSSLDRSDSTAATSSLDSGSRATSPPSDTPPYPISFTQLASLIASGAPIPGIKDIPDKLAEGQPSTSHVDVNEVKKPWQR